METGNAAWILVRHRDGKRLNVAESIHVATKMIDCLGVGLGRSLGFGPAVFTNASGEPIRIYLHTIKNHPRATIPTGWLSKESMYEVRSAVAFLAAVWSRWEPANTSFGVHAACDYLLRASSALYLDWQARDLVIALERMVKAHRANMGLHPGGDIRPQLQDLEGAIGLTAVTSNEREWFRLFRNRLSHEGVLRRPGEAALGNSMFQSVGWLRSFVLRHVFSALNLGEVEVFDYGRIPYRLRRVRAKRFCKPTFVPT